MVIGRSAPKPTFEVVAITDTMILLVDLDQGVSVTNAADYVVSFLNETIEGGIGRRRVFYRGTTNRFDELAVDDHGKFLGYKPCTTGQQHHFAELLQRYKP